MRHLPILGPILACVSQASAACVADDPESMAQWIYDNDRSFYAQTIKFDFHQRISYLSPRLYALLAAKWDCENAEQGICALGADPWINAQAGEILPPRRFELVSSASQTAKVKMTFVFGWQESNSPPPVHATAFLKFIQNRNTGCWHLDDLIGRDGTSLKAELTDFVNSDELDRSR